MDGGWIYRGFGSDEREDGTEMALATDYGPPTFQEIKETRLKGNQRLNVRESLGVSLALSSFKPGQSCISRHYRDANIWALGSPAVSAYQSKHSAHLGSLLPFGALQQFFVEKKVGRKQWGRDMTISLSNYDL